MENTRKRRLATVVLASAVQEIASYGTTQYDEINHFVYAYTHAG